MSEDRSKELAGAVVGFLLLVMLICGAVSAVVATFRFVSQS